MERGVKKNQSDMTWAICCSGTNKKMCRFLIQNGFIAPIEQVIIKSKRYFTRKGEWV
jgi:hypothetical protein